MKQQQTMVIINLMIIHPLPQCYDGTCEHDTRFVTIPLHVGSITLPHSNVLILSDFIIYFCHFISSFPFKTYNSSFLIISFFPVH